MAKRLNELVPVNDETVTPNKRTPLIISSIQSKNEKNPTNLREFSAVRSADRQHTYGLSNFTTVGDHSSLTRLVYRAICGKDCIGLFIEEAKSMFSSSSESSFSTPHDWQRVDELTTVERSRTNILAGLTVNITRVYKTCNPEFRAIEVLPQRLLSHPSDPVANNGHDNAEGNLICRVHDKLMFGDKTFTILDLLGTGTFGQVFRCKRDDTKELVAVKVIKNKPAYHTQGMLEIKIARLLNTNYDPSNDKHIVRLLESFEFKGHICMAFELLSMSLLDLLTQNQFRGLPLSIVQKFTKQILTALIVLEDANIIHCDLKPENILIVPSQQLRRKQPPPKTKSDSADGLASAPSGTEPPKKAAEPRKPSSSSSDIKVIDFGSACFEGRTIYSYIQSRFCKFLFSEPSPHFTFLNDSLCLRFLSDRSPEVLLGAPYTGAIDMWSLACVCAEMYLGLPLFPGVSQHNQLSRITEILGVPPDFLIESKNGHRYYAPVLSDEEGKPKEIEITNTKSSSFLTSASITSNNSTNYRIKTAEEYAAETNTEVPVVKKYLRYNQLEDIIMKCSLPNKAKLTPEQKSAEMLRRQSFLDFLRGLFKLNPFERWTAKQAFEHPFIKNVPITAPFVPPQDLKVQERKLMFMVQMQQRQGVLDEASSAAAKQQQQQNLSLKGMKAPPTNFGTNTAGANFTPLQYSNRRLSEPVDPHIAQASLKTKPPLISGGASNFDSAERPSLKRGDPVHAKQQLQSTAAEAESNGSMEIDNDAAVAQAVSEIKVSDSSAPQEPAAKAVPGPDATSTGPANSKVDAPHQTAASSLKQSLQASPSQHTNNTGNNGSKAKPRRSFSDGQQQHQVPLSSSNSNNNNNLLPPQQMQNMPYPQQQQQQNMGPQSFMPAQQQFAGPPMQPPIPVYGGLQSFGGMPPPSIPIMPPPMAGSWQGNFPPPIPPGMIHQAMPFYAGSLEGNGSLMYPPAVPVPMMDSYYGGNLAGSLPNGGGNVAGSLSASFAPSSYGVFAIGSMPDGPGGMRMQEFATNLPRAEADEQRRFLSQQGVPGYPMSQGVGGMPGYWPPPPAQATYTPYNNMNPNNGMMVDSGNGSNNAIYLPPHFQGSIANYMMRNAPMPPMPMAQSYDSRVQQRFMQRQPPVYPVQQQNDGQQQQQYANYQQQPQQEQAQQPQQQSQGRSSGGNNSRRNSEHQPSQLPQHRNSRGKSGMSKFTIFSDGLCNH